MIGLLAGQGRTAEAVEILSRAWKTCPAERVAVAALSLYDAPSVTEAERREVETWLAAASQKRPDLVVLSEKLGLLWLRRGRVDEAEALYRRVLGSNPDDPEALNSLAWLLALRDPGKPQEALECIDHAIEVRGRIASLIDTRAVVLIRSGRASQAIEELKDAQQLDERKSSVALHLAWAYQALGKTAEAKQAFQQAVNLGWKAENSDPLERKLIDKLRHDLGRS